MFTRKYAYLLRTKYIYLPCLLIIVYAVFSNFINNRKSDTDDLSCHNIRQDIEYLGEKMYEGIFFHETTCKGELNSRQCCAVEAAARAHPFKIVHVLFLAPVTRKTFKQDYLLQEFDNVEVGAIFLPDYVKGTPVESITKNSLRSSMYRVAHTSDVLRYLSLYKWGGIYLDLDVLVVRSLDTLGGNWAAKESDVFVASNALAFSDDEIGRNVSEAAIRDIGATYKGDVWAHNGPGVITRVLNDRCKANDTQSMSADTCQGFDVLDYRSINSWRYTEAKKYFEAGDIPDSSYEPYGYHIWNKMSSGFQIHQDSPYAKLARKYCPSTYKWFGPLFL